MNDTFYEQIVVRKRSIYDHLSIVLAVIFALILIFLSIISFNPLILVILIILGFASYHFKIPNTRLEFEYSILNSEMNIDMIINKAKRKSIKTFDIKSTKLLTKKGSPALKEYIGTKQFNYSSNDESMDTYIIITSNNNTNEAYIMNLDEQMLTMIRNYIPRQVQI